MNRTLIELISRNFVLNNVRIFHVLLKGKSSSRPRKHYGHL